MVTEYFSQIMRYLENFIAFLFYSICLIFVNMICLCFNFEMLMHHIQINVMKEKSIYFKGRMAQMLNFNTLSFSV